MSHTPTPWQWDGDDLWHFGESYESESDPHRYTGIATHTRINDKSEILRANKALIVERVNGWDALVQEVADHKEGVANLHRVIEGIKAERDKAFDLLGSAATALEFHHREAGLAAAIRALLARLDGKETK